MRCLEKHRQTIQGRWKASLFKAYESGDAYPEAPPLDHTPCHCEECVGRVGITVPQQIFKRDRKDGYVSTCDIRKIYKPVISKRWLDVENFGSTTLPFGYKY